MKTGLFALSALSLIQQLAAAQPHGHKHVHKRGDIVTESTTIYAPEVVIWVYEDGETASIETRTPNVPIPTGPPAEVQAEVVAEPTPEASTSEIYSPVQAYAESSTPIEAPPPPTPTPESESPPPPPPPTSEPAPSSSPQTPPPADTPSGLGICYSPYNADGTCKTSNQVSSDLSRLAGYSTVRIYGVDCDQIATVLPAAAANKLKVFAGLLTISSLQSDLESMMKQLPGNSFDGTPITTISIGNELVDMGKASVGDVVSALETARGILGNAGFKGSIVTVDTFNALIQNPKLCEASDFCAANAHSYFDPTITPDQAGAWLRKQVARISDAVGGAKKVVITETGWPHAGRDNGIAHPGKEEQRTAMESVKGEWGKESWGGMFLFSAFDDKWKQPGPWEVERNWGIN